MITSKQNPKLKLIRALAGKPKERREEKAFLVEGVRLVEEALAANWPIRFVLYADGISERGMELVRKLGEKNIDVEQASGDLLQSTSETETSQGIIAVLDDFQTPIPESPNFILILDLIREPGNLGTLLRTASATGVQAVFLPPETTDAFAPKVVRAGMGAHFRLPIYSLSWDKIRARLGSASHPTEQADQAREDSARFANKTYPSGATHPHLQVFLADAKGTQSCWQADFKSPLALIVGGEAEGASDEARKLAKVVVNIPMPGKAESLNAAVAGSVLMFEVVRQRA